MKAIVLVGGYAKRLRPLTENTPKALLPIVGKPIIHYIIEQLQETFSSDIALVSIQEKDMYEISYSDPFHLPVDINEKSLISKLDKLILEKFASPETSIPYILVNDIIDDTELFQIFNIFWQRQGQQSQETHGV